MTEVLPFNINNYVRVKLTNDGREALRRRDEEMYARAGLSFVYACPEEDADGWSRWQLWELMQKLGDRVLMGGRLPFETTIEILTDGVQL